MVQHFYLFFEEGYVCEVLTIEYYNTNACPRLLTWVDTLPFQFASHHHLIPLLEGACEAGLPNAVTVLVRPGKLAQNIA